MRALLVGGVQLVMRSAACLRAAALPALRLLLCSIQHLRVAQASRTAAAAAASAAAPAGPPRHPVQPPPPL